MNDLSLPYGLTVRYAVKANPHPDILKMIDKSGIHFDASSSYEAKEIMRLGIAGNKVSLSSQQSPHDLANLLSAKVNFVATSINQLKLFLAQKNHPQIVGVRINPDMGFGHNKRTSTGGVTSSFGIWYKYIEEVLNITKSSGVIIDRVHIHAGSGADPKVWAKIMDRSLKIVGQFPDATCLDIGGGFKVHRHGQEPEADMAKIIEMFGKKLKDFYRKTGRKIHLEIEPGTYLIAHAGTLVATIDDIVDTGKGGYTFIKLDTGMNDFLRSAMYGARHKIEVMNKSKKYQQYVVIGHNCESGDILTPTSGNPEEIATIKLREAKIGDEVRIYDVGAYGASMRAKGYNSFPDATEIFVN